MWSEEEQKILSFLLSSSGNLEMLMALEKLGKATISEWMREIGESDESVFRKRLEELINYGLVKKVSERYDEKEHYFLTQRGEGLLNFIKSMRKDENQE